MPSASAMDQDECAPECDGMHQPREYRDEPPHALDRALELLQGGIVPSLADPGITLLSPMQLGQLHLHAQQLAEQHRENILLLLDLLESGQPHDAAPEKAVMQRMLRLLHRHYRDQQRWQSLADNAAYYGDHPQVTDRIAAWIRANTR